ncbi:MAG: ABC transporter permease [Bacteroidia bacterium]
MKTEHEQGRSPAWHTRKRFLKNRLAVVGLSYILLLTLIAIPGYLILPDPSPDANAQIIELKTQPPGTQALILKKRKNLQLPETSFLSAMLEGRESPYNFIPVAEYEFVKDSLRITRVTGWEGEKGPTEHYLLADIHFALDLESVRSEDNTVYFEDAVGGQQQIELQELANLVEENNLEKRHFLLGTDSFGRDLFSRLLLGIRVSLSVGFIAVLISLVIGITLGTIGGYFRGFADDVVMWFINVWWSLPTLLLVIAFSLALGKGFWQVFVAVGVSMWVEVARIVRGQIMSTREKEFVEAARALGYGSFRTITRHLLPNITGPLIVVCAANFAAAILLEAGLSFLGIGVQPPVPSWGYMIKENYMMIVFGNAYLAVLPGIFICLTVLAFYLVGNGLQDALDVRGK